MFTVITVLLFECHYLELEMPAKLPEIMAGLLYASIQYHIIYSLGT